ncbi:MAG: glycosyltransferase [Candidatus Omnitrophica bacterium]|nr:glycosyltransferase [Candidatus Omnitrophota bacterium]
MGDEPVSRILPLTRFLFFAAFCFFVFCLPFSKACVEIAVAIIFAGWLLSGIGAFFLDRRELRRSFFSYFGFPPLTIHGVVLLFLLALTASALASILSGMEAPIVMRGWIKYGKWFVVFYTSAELFRHPRWLRPMMKIMTAGLGLIIFDALIQFIFDYDFLRGYTTSRPFPIPRLKACFDSENAFAAYLILTLPPVFFALFHWIQDFKLKKNKMLTGLGTALWLCFSLFALAQTRTRSAWLGILFSLLVLCTFIRKRAAVMLLATMVCIVFVPFALNGINEKLSRKNPDFYKVERDEEVFRFSSEDIFERMTLWKQAWGIFKKQPWFGAGPNTYNVMITRNPIPDYQVTPYAHNSYLQVLAELGVVGTLPLLVILAWVIAVCWKTLWVDRNNLFARNVLMGLLAGLIGLLIKAAFDTEFHSLQRILLFWFLAGMAVGTALSLEKNKKKSAAVPLKKLKIVHAANYQSLQNLIQPHMRHQKLQGCEVVGLTSRQAPYDQLDGIRVEKIEFEAQSFQPATEFMSFLRLMKFFYREAPDVVHTHNVKFGVFGRLSARAAGVPYVMHTAHGIYRTFGKQSFKNRLIDWLEKMCGFCCDAVFFVSPFDYETYLKSNVVPAEKALLMGNGIDLHRFDSLLMTEDARKKKKEELGIGPRTKVIGMVGRLVQDKGFSEFFEATQKLVCQYDDIFLMIVSSSYQRADNVSESIAEKYGVKGKTLFLYDREDMPALYSIMDVLAHPSWREGLPRVLMEAASMGVFCVVTDIPGNRNVIRDETYGKLVPVRQPEKLYEALHWALQHPEECERMAGRAQDYARENFDEHVMIDKLDEGYQKAISGYAPHAKMVRCQEVSGLS